MVHVDDVMFCGDGWYWRKCFPQEAQGALQISHSQFAGHWKRDRFLETQNQETGGRPGSHSRYKSLKGD